MIVYRICKAKYADDLTGFGAEKYGGRWNSVGIKMLYTAQSISLSNLEVAVHLPFDLLPEDYVLVTIEFPDKLPITNINVGELGTDWKLEYHLSQQVGDIFFKSEKIFCLKVPSAIVEGESNYLLNPVHKAFDKVKIVSIVPFDFDKRLFFRK